MDSITTAASVVAAGLAVSSGIFWRLLIGTLVMLLGGYAGENNWINPALGFVIGICSTLFFSTNYYDLISIRIAIGSGAAFLVAQLLDVQVFDKLRKNIWYIAPLISSLIGSIVDTFLFFSIAFAGTDVPWITLSLGDLTVKLFVAFVMLVPFRLLLNTFKPIT